ncbi:MAG: alpha/beta fold hydrolase [Gaiellales bacterium]
MVIDRCEKVRCVTSEGREELQRWGDTAETRYALTADGVHIAYRTLGAGSEDLVFIAPFPSNFEVELEEPHFARAIEAMASRWRVILFDKRGSGLSDRQNTPDLEMRADDLRAVLDAVGSQAAILVGTADGGALGAFFAATYPQRVLALVPLYSWARIAWAPDYPFGQRREEFLKDLDRMAAAWGTLELAEEWTAIDLPSLVGDESFARWFAKAMRHAASPATAVEGQHIWYETDVRAILGSIQVPTLVVVGENYSAAGDANAMTRYMAEHIPGATLMVLSGADAFPYSGDSVDIVEAISRFVASHQAEQDAFDRVLATVLFTDIVDSTPHAAKLGDQAWKNLLARHHQGVRAMLARYRGVEVDTAGDGFFATFDGPARAVRCAQAIAAAVTPLGIEIRAGVHTGEVTETGDNVGGLAVHIGARVGALAGPSQVVVSSTVRDLVVGSGLAFADAGVHTLKGVPEEWQLYRALPPLLSPSARGS